MITDLTVEELSAGLDGVIDEILARCGYKRPPVDSFAVARALGITVALDDSQEGRARYVRLRGRSGSGEKAAILVHSDPRFERLQWAVAHEIGEHEAHRAFKRLGIDPCEADPRIREQIANRLAGRLLIPSRWFDKDGADCCWDLLKLKRRYRTASHELLARRMLECRPAVIITIFDQGRITFRRGNFPGRIPPLSPTELDCRRIVHELNEPRETTAGLCRIQCWPVHEVDWLREIMRLEIENFEDCF
jgi:hypothetical protein